jgi:hypothetical protein
MHLREKSAAVGNHKLTWSFPIHSRRALHLRIWSRLLRALQESRSKEAAEVIRRHPDFIQNFRDIDLSGRSDSSKSERRQSPTME